MTGVSPACRESWLADEHLRWPPAEPIRYGGDPQRIAERERAELELADVLLSPSDFVTDSLRVEPACQGKPVIPVSWPLWGKDLAMANPRHLDTSRPFRVLFAGGVNLWKGVLYLTEALSQLKHPLFEARYVGGVNLPERWRIRCQEVATLMGDVPYDQIGVHYAWADTLVLPSLVEGLAQVTLEATAAGLPVIVTRNTGAPIRDGVDGLFIPTRDSASIADAIQSLAGDSRLYHDLSSNAVDAARSRTLARYARELEEALELACSLGA
jgi:glycosyltransferase involved in cell wall biosynthesis